MCIGDIKNDTWISSLVNYVNDNSANKMLEKLVVLSTTIENSGVSASLVKMENSPFQHVELKLSMVHTRRDEY